MIPNPIVLTDATLLILLASVLSLSSGGWELFDFLLLDAFVAFAAFALLVGGVVGLRVDGLRVDVGVLVGL